MRLHYIERGTGEPLVLIHGNGTLIQDFTVNGLVDRLSERYRVIVIERPGYGYSERPRHLWTPRAHATLYEHALHQLGVEQAIVLGHSWGTMVAVSLALQAPTLVRSLVLLSGYYFPTARMDVVLSLPNAIPGIGVTAYPFKEAAVLPRASCRGSRTCGGWTGGGPASALEKRISTRPTTSSSSTSATPASRP